MLAWWVHDLARALDKNVIVTANNGPGWRWTNLRHKSDRGDAAKLIKMHLSGQLEPEVLRPVVRPFDLDAADRGPIQPHPIQRPAR